MGDGRPLNTESSRARAAPQSVKLSIRASDKDANEIKALMKVVHLFHYLVLTFVPFEGKNTSEWRVRFHWVKIKLWAEIERERKRESWAVSQREIERALSWAVSQNLVRCLYRWHQMSVHFIWGDRKICQCTGDFRQPVAISCLSALILLFDSDFELWILVQNYNKQNSKTNNKCFRGS